MGSHHAKREFGPRRTGAHGGGGGRTRGRAGSALAERTDPGTGGAGQGSQSEVSRYRASRKGRRPGRREVWEGAPGRLPGGRGRQTGAESEEREKGP